MSKKIALGFLRFVSMLFLIFEKEMSKKIVPGFLRVVSMLSLIFEKGMSKEIVPGFLRFVSMLFNVTINVIILSIRGCRRDVESLYVCFL